MSAIQKGASDIHIEPYEKELRVRYRIDGILYNIMPPPMKFRDAITSRIKIMAKLDIAEKRLPQDGRIKIRFQDDGEMQGHRLPRLVPADALRREDRHASARQGQADARHDQARVRARVARRSSRSRSTKPWGMVLVTGPDRLRQDQHAVLVDLADQHGRDEHHDRRGPGRVQPDGRQPGAGPREHRPELRRRAPQLPASGPEHHPRRRDPRLRNGGDRGQGGADRPPRAVDAAHQRRAQHHQPLDEHGHRAVPGRQLAEPGVRAAPGAPHLQELHGTAPDAGRRR